MQKERWLYTPNTRFCPLCSKQDYLTVAKKMQHGLDLQTVICKNCGFVFINPMPTEETYNAFYREAYADFYGGIASSPNPSQTQQEPPYISRLLDALASKIELQGASLLELGPGKGQYLYWASKRGMQVLGVEPSPEFNDVLAEYGLATLNTTLEELDPNVVGTFDTIAMFHVFEHFYDPNHALKCCRNLLKDDGLLEIIVPNILAPYRSLDRYFLRYVHPSNFSPSTLRAMLEKHGFQIEDVQNIGDKWYEPISLFILARKKDSVSEHFNLPEQNYNEVYTLLKGYQRHWVLWQRQRWHFWKRYQGLKRYARRGIRFLRRNIQVRLGI